MSDTTLPQLTVDLRAFAASLSAREIARPLRNALRKEARRLRREVVRQLRATGVHYTPALGRTIRSGESRDARGVYTTVRASPRTNAGMHKNRRGHLKPVAMWLADGTAERITRGGRRAPHPTGAISPGKYGGWLERAKKVHEPQAAAEFYKEIDRQVEKAAHSHGLL